MSCILYYSRYCESSSKILASLSKFDLSNEIHFICIDKRINKNGKIYVILDNGQEMLLPEHISKVPALILLTEQYKIIYGNEILNYFQKSLHQKVNHATKNNTIPNQLSSESLGFSPFSGFGGGLFTSGIVSDSYSFLDQNELELKTTGNGGLRQMHNYALLDGNNISFNRPSEDSNPASNKIKEGELTIEQLQQMRANDLLKYGGR
jgi:hypothetical protein